MAAERTLTGRRTPRAKQALAAWGAAAPGVLLAGSVWAQSPSGIAGVVAPGVEPELVQEGFVFTEGPVGTPDGGLYFSDIRPKPKPPPPSPRADHCSRAATTTQRR